MHIHKHKNISHLYGRRYGHKLRPRQAGLMENLLPKIAVNLPKEGEIDLGVLFPMTKGEIWLEIGFGGGEHLFWQAERNQDVGIIGGEPYMNGVASLLSEIDDHDTSNIRIYPDDMRDVLDCLPDASIARAFLLFPDPWPKARHHKRRFVSNENLDRLARVLKPGGELRFASDIPNYVFWTLRHLRQHEAFDWVVSGPDDWRERSADWPETRYERKAIKAGRKPAYLRFKRLASSG